MLTSTTVQPACIARIDTIALRHNYAKLKEHSKGSKILVLLKANAYGHGLLTIANALPEADAFGVARLAEAIRFREAGITNRVVILAGLQHSEEWLIADRLQLDIVIHQQEQLQACVDFCSSLKPEQVCGFNIWLKFDTGMHRLGFSLHELNLVKASLSALTQHLSKPIVVMSHFANADEIDNPLNLSQAAAFGSIRKSLLSNSSNFEFTLDNSSALLARPDNSMDWVRPGLALFGVTPFLDKVSDDFGLKPVMSLESRIIATKTLEVGEGVGYGQTWTAKHATRIGIASIGYGDGYPWQAPNGTPVMVAGIQCTLVGRVSMDLIAIDLSPAPNAKIGSCIQLWGDQLPVEEVANHAQTIPYTLLCGITQRVSVDII